MVPTWLKKFLNGPASFWDLLVPTWLRVLTWSGIVISCILHLPSQFLKIAVTANIDRLCYLYLCTVRLYLLHNWHLPVLLSLKISLEDIIWVESRKANFGCKKARKCSGGSRQTFDRVLSQKNLAKNEVIVHFHSNLEILTRFQKLCDPVWIRGLDPPLKSYQNMELGWTFIGNENKKWGAKLTEIRSSSVQNLESWDLPICRLTLNPQLSVKEPRPSNNYGSLNGRVGLECLHRKLRDLQQGISCSSLNKKLRRAFSRQANGLTLNIPVL